MTGLAATMGAETPAAATAIADALAGRGTDLASWRAGGAHLVVRAAMPAVHETVAGALLLDGDAAPSTLAAGYTERGPRGLLAGADPYALVLADLARDALVLARNGDGPPLYWARHGPAVLVASEPVALLAAGVPARPDPAVVERFLATGACDEGPATFFAGIRRVLADQLVEVAREPGSSGYAVRAHDPLVAPAVSPAVALAAADLTGRIGVRVGRGLAAAAVLGAALARPDRPRPLPVYSTTFPELAAADSSAYRAATLLGPYPQGAARHRALPFFVDEIDVDAYLADLGEPTPELDDWLRWATARRVAGEVDVLVDAATDSYLSRLSDRLASRFGVALRVPLRPAAGPQHPPDPTTRGEPPGAAGERPPGVPAGPSPPPATIPGTDLATVVRRTLPGPAAELAAAGGADLQADDLLAGVLRRMRAELVTTFLRPRATRGGLADALRLLSGGRVDAGSLWRRYLVERWLRSLPPPDGSDHSQEASREASRRAGAGRRSQAGTPPELVAAGRRWTRTRVRTELFAEGDKIPEKLAWYVGEATTSPPAEPWFVLVAGKPVAVMQGRARNLWDIHPGATARLLHRLAAVRFPAAPAPPERSDATAWAIQVAIEEGGWWRLAAAAGCLLAGRPAGYARVSGPALRAIREPREDSAPPGHVCVVPAPAGPDRVATDVVTALRATLPEPGYATLGGCAIVSPDGDVLGWAARPGAAAPPPGLPAALVADDPFGDDQTPIVVATPAADPG